MKRLIILLAAVMASVVLSCASADPARTDGTVTAWIGENNELFMICSDGVTRKLSAPMKDILRITDKDVIGLTQNNQLVSVRLDGGSYSVLSADASEEEIAGQEDKTFTLEDGKLTVNETVFSERAAAATTDGRILYWVNRSETGFVLMEKGLPGKEKENFGREPVFMTGMSVPEPVFMCVTGEALTLTAADRTITAISLTTGETKVFPASGQQTAGACMAGERLYRYTATETLPWELETIQNDAMRLMTVTPAPATMTPVPTATPTPVITPVPTRTPVVTAVPTATPGDDNIHKGARGSTVRRIQQRLKELGYPVGNVDGDYGEQTQVAVNLFYDAIHTRERNYITPSMRTKLFSAGAPQYDPYMPLQKGDKGLSVLYMQTRLKQVGYDPGKLDGVYGTMTIQAVADFQKSVGYLPAPHEVRGEYASHDLLEKLFGPESTPTPTFIPGVPNEDLIKR